MVVGAGFQARNRGQGGGQQALLEDGERLLEPGTVGLGLPTGFLGSLAGAQQFRLVGAAVTGVEEGGADQQGSPSSLVFTFEVTSTGIRSPAALMSMAMPPASPFIWSSGAKCVS